MNTYKTLSVCARQATFNRVLRIVVARRRWMASRDESVDERLVFGVEAVREPAEIVVPLRLGARTGDGGGNEPVVEHPIDRELSRRHAARFGAGLDPLRQFERLATPFGLHDPLVLAAGAGVGRRR